MSEFMRFLAGLVAAKLTEAQRDGFACVVCGLNYLATLVAVPHVPVGVVEGGQVFACSACVPVEEVELVRADELAVVEVVRTAGAAPVVRFSVEERVENWTADRALMAAAAFVAVAEQEIEADPEDAEWFMASVLDVVEAILSAARLVRDEIEAAA